MTEACVIMQTALYTVDMLHSTAQRQYQGLDAVAALWNLCFEEYSDVSCPAGSTTACQHSIANEPQVSAMLAVHCVVVVQSHLYMRSAPATI